MRSPRGAWAPVLFFWALVRYKRPHRRRADLDAARSPLPLLSDAWKTTRVRRSGPRGSALYYAAAFSNNRRRRADLKPGQRVELAASGRFGKTVDLDLAKLVNTSRLISLMPHAASFKTQLQRAVNKQRSTLDIGSKGPQVDVLTGLSYAPPKSTLVESKEITPSINQPVVHTKGSPVNTSVKAVVQKATKENSPKDYPLPFIPGPTPRFHAPPMPEPTLKDIFPEPPTKSNTPFPGRIFNR